jgi:hypothetical protein
MEKKLITFEEPTALSEMNDFAILEEFALFNNEIDPKAFMYMGSYDGLELFKHHGTRRYLNLMHGIERVLPFRYNECTDSYTCTTPKAAIEHVLG